MACRTWIFIFMIKITVYSTAVSQHGKELKDYFEERGVSYLEKLVDQDALALEEMKSASGGFAGVPFVLLEKNGVKEGVVGFDKAKIESFLNL